MTLQFESSLQVQEEELIKIISKLSALLAKVREAFSRNKELPVEDVESQLRDITEEIAFTAIQADEHLPGTPTRKRKPSFQYQSILGHLHVVTTLIGSLVDQLQKQILDDISFYEQAINQSDILFRRQEMTLCTLVEAIRAEDEGHLRTVCSSCNELILLCQRAGVLHEKCVVQGHCNPKTALLFLRFLDLMRTLVHHERVIVRLLLQWKRRDWRRQS